MPDALHPLTTDQLAGWIAAELDHRGSLLGLPRSLVFEPAASDPFRVTVSGHELESPYGVAAGPHTQLAQNIIVGWLCGARVIELKTVQTNDRIEVSKPCIDMLDEGLNVEWSQELTLGESAHEYVEAWVLVHVLHRHLGLAGPRPGVLFNLSVGYDLDGVCQANVQRFLETMSDASALIEEIVPAVARHLPIAGEVEIPGRVADTVTLSTMHGCPPEEIGRISSYLMSEWGLHTAVKLNPTLLGAERLRELLHDRLGYRHLVVPDDACANDLTFAEARHLLTELRHTATRAGVDFSVKLSNTLQVRNDGRRFAASEQMMYLSGRPLHALTVDLARRLALEYGGKLSISFAGGADAHRAHRLLACGMTTVTACSDLLAPGGYTRLLDYLETTRSAFAAAGSGSIAEYVCATATRGRRGQSRKRLSAANLRACALDNLCRYADEVLDEPLLRKGTVDRRHTKSERRLGPFDCIAAPCVERCPISQRAPEYLRQVAAGDVPAAAATIRADNPVACALGRACTHPCEEACVRVHYDEPVAIREIKRFAVEHEPPPGSSAPPEPARASVAIVGAGPCGLSAASFLARAGYRVTVLEARPLAGGMVSDTIPGFRSAPSVVEGDVARLEALGVTIEADCRVGRDVTLEELRRDGYRYIVLAGGAQRGRRLGLEGEDLPGVHDGLELLRAVRRGEPPALGARVAVVGGGDVAIDCARTARRLGAGEVRILYRRTVALMPAQREEIEAALDEGVELVELAAPERVAAAPGGGLALDCVRTRLGTPDGSGRARPVAIDGSRHSLALDSLVVAIGQRPDLGLVADAELELTPSGYLAVDLETMETSLPGVFAGGDLAGEGPATIVEAAADGRRIAETIRRREEELVAPPLELPEVDLERLLRHRADRRRRVASPTLAPEARLGFAETMLTLDRQAAVEEAGRCLDCDFLCSLCVSVCPNRAIITYEVEPRRRPGAPEPSAAAPPSPLAVAQRYQVAVLADLCNECGNCETFCPTAGRPWADKPRLHLNRRRLEAEHDNAFMVVGDGGEWSIEARLDGATYRLEPGEVLRFSTPSGRAHCDPESLTVLDWRPARTGSGPPPRLPLELLATMDRLLAGLRASAPGLPSAPTGEAPPDPPPEEGARES